MNKPDQNYENPLSITDSQNSNVPQLDIKKYQSHIEDFELTEEQQRELLETIWSIMISFVDIGFGVDVVQLLFGDTAPNSSNSKPDAVKIKDRSENFNLIACDESKEEANL